MGIEALYPKPNLSHPAPGHEVYPYLPARRRNRTAQPRLEHRYCICSNARWLPLPGGRHGLVQSLRAQLGTLQHDGDRLPPDRAGGGVSLWPTRDLEFGSRAQFTCADFLAPLKKRGVRISMDGRGRALDRAYASYCTSVARCGTTLPVSRLLDSLTPWALWRVVA
jgi:putative transposase